MQAIMPSIVIRTMAVLGLLVCVSAGLLVCHAALFKQPEVKASEMLVNRPKPAVSEENTQAVNRERFRSLFFNERGQLKAANDSSGGRPPPIFIWRPWPRM
jgi:hypothetical protein